jgi:phage shock protein PspC (stress-responsive transcriptional regulator)
MPYPRRKTHKLYREHTGYVLGVLEGLANWSGLPVLALRIIADIHLFKLRFVPIGLAYLGSAILMPGR